MRVSENLGPPERKFENERIQVHLADMALRDLAPQFDKLKAKTERERKLLVEPELLPAARARVTFSLPIASADKLVGTTDVVIDDV